MATFFPTTFNFNRPFFRLATISGTWGIGSYLLSAALKNSYSVGLPIENWLRTS